MAQSTPISGSVVQSYAIEIFPQLCGSVAQGYGPTNAGVTIGTQKGLPAIARVPSLASINHRRRGL